MYSLLWSGQLPLQAIFSAYHFGFLFLRVGRVLLDSLVDGRNSVRFYFCAFVALSELGSRPGDPFSPATSY